jgi:hypothetical protein
MQVPLIQNQNPRTEADTIPIIINSSVNQAVRREVLFGIKPRAYQESVRLCRCPSLLETTTAEHKEKENKETHTSINY